MTNTDYVCQSEQKSIKITNYTLCPCSWFVYGARSKEWKVKAQGWASTHEHPSTSVNQLVFRDCLFEVVDPSRQVRVCVRLDIAIPISAKG